MRDALRLLYYCSLQSRRSTRRRAPRIPPKSSGAYICRPYRFRQISTHRTKALSGSRRQEACILCRRHTVWSYSCSKVPERACLPMSSPRRILFGRAKKSNPLTAYCGQNFPSEQRPTYYNSKIIRRLLFRCSWHSAHSPSRYPCRPWWHWVWDRQVLFLWGSPYRHLSFGIPHTTFRRRSRLGRPQDKRS